MGRRRSGRARLAILSTVSMLLPLAAPVGALAQEPTSTSIEVSPASEELAAGGAASVAARYLQDGTPAADVVLDLRVERTTDGGTSWTSVHVDTGTTDGSGSVAWTYPGAAGVARDRITVWLDADGDAQPDPDETAGSAVRVWTQRFDVDTTADIPDATPGDGLCGDRESCSVRSAFEEASALAAIDPQYQLHVQIPAGLYPLELGPVELGGSGAIAVVGTGETAPHLRSAPGDGSSRVLNVHKGAEVVMRGLVLSDGTAVDGGCVHNAGQLRLEQVVIHSCAADASGGGLHNTGDVTGSDVTVRDNAAGVAGGGVWSVGTVDVDRLQLEGNRAGQRGGGIANEHELFLDDVSTNLNHVLARSGHTIFASGTDGWFDPSGAETTVSWDAKTQELVVTDNTDGYGYVAAPRAAPAEGLVDLGALRSAHGGFLRFHVRAHNQGDTSTYGDPTADPPIVPTDDGLAEIEIVGNDAIIGLDLDDPPTPTGVRYDVRLDTRDAWRWVVGGEGLVSAADFADVIEQATRLQLRAEWLPGGGVPDVVRFDDVVIDAPTGQGGSIHNTGLAELRRGSVNGSTAAVGGGIVSRALTSGDAHLLLDGVTISGNLAAAVPPTEGSAEHGGGGLWAGALEFASTIDASDVSFLGNVARGDGGALALWPGVGGSWRAGRAQANEALDDGGAVEALSAFTVEDVVFADNVARGQGGAVHVDVGSALTFALVSSDLATNVAVDGGGAAVRSGHLHVDDSVVQRNAAQIGAGVEVGQLGRLTLAGSTLRDNAADISGGGIHAQHGDVDIDASTIVGNDGGTEGGGIWSDGPLGLLNSTVSGNAAGYGAGIFRAGPSGNEATQARLEHVTLTDNRAWGGAGGIASPPVTAGTPATLLVNTAVVGNVTAAETGALTASNCSGNTLTAFSVHGPACDATDVGETSTYDVTETQFGPLQDNGGPTLTHAPLEGATVIDVVLDCNPELPTDQRGLPRQVGARCDAGAVESPFGGVDPALAVTLTVDPASTPPGASVVPVDGLHAALGPAPAPSSGTAQSAPLNSVPLNSVPLNSVPLNSVPLNSVPLNSVPLNSVPLNSVSLTDPRVVSVLKGVPASELSLLVTPLQVGGQPFSSISDLVQASDLAGSPLQAISLHDLLQDPVVGAGLAAAPLNSVGYGATPLNSVPVWTVMVGGDATADPPAPPLMLADVPWSAVVGTGDVSDDPETHAAALCDWLATLAFSCADLGLLGPSYYEATQVSLLQASIVGAPLNSVPLNSVPLNSVPLNSVPLNSVPLNSVPLNSVPLNSVPLNSVPLNSVDVAASPLNSVPLNSVPLNSVPLNSVPLNSVPLNSVPLNSVPLNSVDLVASPLNAVVLGDLPAALRDALVSCGSSCPATLGDAAADIQPTATVGLLAQLPAPNGYTLADLLWYVDPSHEALAQTTWGDLGSYGDITLGDLAAHLPDDVSIGATIDWLVTQGVEPSAQAQSLLETTYLGQLLGLGSLTFADLVVLLGETLLRDVLEFLLQFPDSEHISLLDLLLMLLPPSEFPWTQVDLTGGNLQAAAHEQGLANLVTVSVAIDVASPAGSADVTVVLTPPAGAYLPPAGASLDGSPDALTPDHGPGTVTYELSGLADGTHVVTIPVASPLAIGAHDLSVEVRLDEHGLVATAGGGLSVVEEFEPNDTFADTEAAGAQHLADGTLLVSHLGHARDLDLFPVSLETGESLSVFLGNIPEGADYDLVLYGPPGTELPGVGVNSVDTGNGVPQNADDVVLLDGRPALRIAADRGRDPERVDLPPVHFAGDYVVQVSAYNGLADLSPYTIQSEVFPALPLPSCTPWPTDLVDTQAAAPVVTLPQVGPDTRTLILVNRDRYAGAHGTAAVHELDPLLRDIAVLDGSDGSPPVNGAVVVLDEVATIAAAYEAWDVDRCSVSAANAVANAIRQHVNAIRQTAPISSVMIVGSDEQVPFVRVPDFVELSNERTFAPVLPGGTELHAMAAQGYYLSDNLYADSSTEIAGNRPIWVPEIGLGRVVETHVEVMAQLHNYLVSKGTIDPSADAYVTGYDFLSDGAQAVADALPDPVETLISETWTATDLRDRFAQHVPDVLSVNAHYDHANLLSADDDEQGTQTDLFATSDVVGDYVDAVAFTSGCHAGLSVADVSVGFGVQDWAQTYGAQLASFVGNTGYGYGDTEIVALSETLMAEFAERLDDVPYGTALSFAKAEYAADLSTYGVYDEKVLMQATFYGVPMYRVAGAGGTTTVEPPVALDVDHGLTSMPVHFGDDQTIEPRSGSLGQHYVVVDGGQELRPQATFDQPIVPRWDHDVTAHDGFGGVGVEARGAVIESLTVMAPTAHDPALSLPVVDQGEEAVEPFLTDVAFPSTFTRVSRAHTPAGPRDQLTFITGQVIGTSRDATFNGFSDADLRVYYAPPDAADREAPRILWTRASVQGDVAAFSVEATDASAIQRALILYREPGALQWHAADLGPAGTTPAGAQRLTGSAVLSAPLAGDGAVSYLVQVVDAAGNVGVSSAKALFHSAPALVPSVPGDPSDPATPGTPALSGEGGSPWFTGPVTLTLVGDADGDAAVTVDGRAVALPHTFDTSGVFEVAVRDEGVVTVRFVLVDLEGPTVTIHRPADGAVVAKSSAVPLQFTATDNGSGVDAASVSDEPDLLDTSTTGVKHHTVTVRDRLDPANTTSATVTYHVVTLQADPSPVRIGDPFSLDVIGLGGGPDLEVDWGDATGWSLESTTPVTGGARLTHVYASPGLYRIQVRKGGAPLVYEYAVVYDPDVGHVTGGGQFDSPAGAVLSDPGVFGRAVFGFNAKYRQGTSVPDGRTNFQFVDGELQFASTSYDWLLIEGARAQYYGEGTVNGNGGYRFTLVGIDGDVGDPLLQYDKVRVRIWRVNADGTDGPAVYDNGLGAPIDSNAGTVISRGQITIHPG